MLPLPAGRCLVITEAHAMLLCTSQLILGAWRARSDDVGVTWKGLKLKQGWWRASNDSEDFLQCLRTQSNHDLLLVRLALLCSFLVLQALSSAWVARATSALRTARAPSAPTAWYQTLVIGAPPIALLNLRSLCFAEGVQR